MSTYTDLSAQLKTLVSGITNIGQVHAYQRYVADWAKLLELFKIELIAGQQQYRGWWITLAQPAITSEASEFGTRDRVYHFLIVGIQGLQDAANTESTIIQNTEAILDVLDAQTTFGVSGVVVRGFDAQCRVVEIRPVGSVQCNVSEITVDVPVEKTF